MTKCPTCDCCEGKEYLDKRSGKIKINLCMNCRCGLNGHKKMAKPKPDVLKTQQEDLKEK